MSEDILRRYWLAVRAALLKLVLISLALAALAFVVSVRVSPVYEVHFSYLVSLSNREQPDGYTYDGVYALQSTDLFTATLAQWASAPEIIVEAYRAAGLPLLDLDPRSVTRGIVSEKTAPQLVRVTVKNEKKADAEKLAAGLRAVISRNVERYHQDGIPALKFRVVPTESWTGVTRFNSIAVTVATFLAVLLLGANWVVFREGLKG